MDKQGGFAVLPAGLFEEKATVAITNNFVKVKEKSADQKLLRYVMINHLQLKHN